MKNVKKMSQKCIDLVATESNTLEGEENSSLKQKGVELRLVTVASPQISRSTVSMAKELMS